MDDQTLTFTIDGPDGADDLDVPEGIIHLLAEEDDETMAQVVGDIALMAFASRAHALVHHAEGDADDRVRAIEEDVLDAFEDRFGVTYGEATGHQH